MLGLGLRIGLGLGLGLGGGGLGVSGELLVNHRWMQRVSHQGDCQEIRVRVRNGVRVSARRRVKDRVRVRVRRGGLCPNHSH